MNNSTVLFVLTSCLNYGAISDVNLFPSRSTNVFPLNPNFKRGSHPNLQALHHMTFGNQEFNANIPNAHHQEFKTTGTLASPLLHRALYFPRQDEDPRIHHSISSEVLPQSFSGVYYDPIHPTVPGDLGLALHRPGVAPIALPQLVHHHVLHNQMPPNTLIRSGSFASLHGDNRHWNYRNRHSNIQRNYPSSYSDIHVGNFPANAVIAPILNLQPVPLYQPGIDHGRDNGLTKMKNSLLAQQLSEYSAMAPLMPPCTHQLTDGNNLLQSVNNQVNTHTLQGSTDQNTSQIMYDNVRY